MRCSHGKKRLVLKSVNDGLVRFFPYVDTNPLPFLKSLLAIAAVSFPTAEFSGYGRGGASAERVEHHVSRTGARTDNTVIEGKGFLCRKAVPLIRLRRQHELRFRP